MTVEELKLLLAEQVMLCADLRKENESLKQARDMLIEANQKLTEQNQPADE